MRKTNVNKKRKKAGIKYVPAGVGIIISTGGMPVHIVPNKINVKDAECL